MNFGWTVHVWPTWDDPDMEEHSVFTKDVATLAEAFDGMADVFGSYPGAYTELHICIHQTGVPCSHENHEDELEVT